MNSIELFSGAGGLALGTSNAGFSHRVVLEWDKNACDTIRHNRARRLKHVRDWEIYEGDVRKYDYSRLEGEVDFVFGGPPCQPFSIGGNHKGNVDCRNMFPEAIRAVREIKPKAFIFENVKGFLRKNFSNYFHYILNQLRFPLVCSKGDEEWSHHQTRLEKIYSADNFGDLHYRVLPKLLNAADYGVPQKRERVFIVGIRSDLHVDFSFPDPTHEEDALLYDKWVTGEYWEKHKVPKTLRQSFPPRLTHKIANLGSLMPSMMLKSWRTVRDAIYDLPRISEGEKSDSISNHYFNPGARSYAGHNGSPYDEPAKTLKAGDHGVPGGENTLRMHDDSVRYFSVRECARLQTFPDTWGFKGSWTECMRQLGNAVPVKLGEAVAKKLSKEIITTERKILRMTSNIKDR